MGGCDPSGRWFYRVSEITEIWLAGRKDRNFLVSGTRILPGGSFGTAQTKPARCRNLQLEDASVPAGFWQIADEKELEQSASWTGPAVREEKSSDFQPKLPGRHSYRQGGKAGPSFGRKF